MSLDITINWIVESLIPQESIILLSGRGGIGKTWLSLQLAKAITEGESFMGLETKKMSVVYIDFENSLAVLVERVKLICATEVSFWHPSATTGIKPPKLDSDNFDLYKKLPSQSLIIIDTLRASQMLNENDSKEMSLIMERLKELRDLGFTILLLHHTPKYDSQIYKGSTAIFDLSDHVLSLSQEKGSYRLGTKDKTRYEPFEIFLNFKPETGFVTVDNPDESNLEKIYCLLEKEGELNQGQIFEKAKEVVNIRKKEKFLELLKKGEGRFWKSRKKGNSVFYSIVPHAP